MAFEQIRGSFARLSSREKMLVGACAAALLGFILFLVFRSVGGKLSNLAKQVERQDEQLAEILKGRGKFRDSEARFREIEGILKRPAPQLRGFLERIAKNLNLSIQEYKDLPITLLGKNKQIQEQSIMVYPVKPDLKQLTALLTQIENTREHFLVVKDLRLDRAFDDHDRFQRAEVVVSTYQLVAPEPPRGGSPGAGPGPGPGR